MKHTGSAYTPDSDSENNAKPVSTKATLTDLKNILVRYEGAVSACERDGDDSDIAVEELSAARTALLNVLLKAKAAL